MKMKITVRYLIIFIYFLSSCVSKPTSGRNATIDSVSSLKADSSIKLYTLEHNKYLTFGTMRFLIPKEININSENIYNGIYEVQGHSFKRYKSVTFNNLAFLTTSEDLGYGIRSYLYVFDIRNKSLIKDSTFKRNYLYSSAAIFIIEPHSRKIFSLDRPEWYEAKRENIVPGSISCIKGSYFKNLKNIYKVGDELPSDTSLISFFNDAMATNSNEVHILPDYWWRTNK